MCVSVCVFDVFMCVFVCIVFMCVNETESRTFHSSPQPFAQTDIRPWGHEVFVCFSVSMTQTNDDVVTRPESYITHRRTDSWEAPVALFRPVLDSLDQMLSASHTHPYEWAHLRPSLPAMTISSGLALTHFLSSHQHFTLMNEWLYISSMRPLTNKWFTNTKASHWRHWAALC